MSQVQLSLHIVLIALVMSVVACGRAMPQANNVGNEAFAKENYEAALQAYERAQTEAPDVSEPYYNSGNTYYRQQEFDKAQESFQQALLNADEELTQSGVFNLGNTFFSRQEFGEAIEAYRQALRLNPDDIDAKHNLELALRQLQQQGQPEQGQQEQTSPQQNGQEEQEEQEQDQQGQEEGQESQDEQQQSEDGEQESQETQPDQTQISALTLEQAKQLLESIGRNTETLQGHLQRTFVVPGRPPARDW